jgi:CBS domain-containing protein
LDRQNQVLVWPPFHRLIAAEELGALDKETAQSLREAFAFIWQVRLDHHAQQIRAGLPPDNLIRPDQLPPLARKELREALRAIAAAQQQLNRFIPLGI